MKDVTPLMNTYRECSRNLWNAYFSLRVFTWDLHDEYENIRKLLFEALVVNELDPEHHTGPELMLKVVPDGSVPILINRPSDGGGGYWDQEMDMRVGEGDVRLGFLDYFDYSQYPVKDFQFFRCKISHFPDHTKYEGREALLEVSHAKVFHDERAR
jgi:hypothetical protein